MVRAATLLQSMARGRLDTHKITELKQQCRVEEIIAQKEQEMQQEEERKRMKQTKGGILGGIMMGGNVEEEEDEIKAELEVKIPLEKMTKADIPPDGKFWGHGWFVYWSEKHDRPYFYNPEEDETSWLPPDDDDEDSDAVSEFSDEEENMAPVSVPLPSCRGH